MRVHNRATGAVQRSAQVTLQGCLLLIAACSGDDKPPPIAEQDPCMGAVVPCACGIPGQLYCEPATAPTCSCPAPTPGPTGGAQAGAPAGGQPASGGLGPPAPTGGIMFPIPNTGGRPGPGAGGGFMFPGSSGGMFPGSGGMPEPDASGGVMATGDEESGVFVGMTAAHNAVRATVSPEDPLPDLAWSADLAAYAQEWTDTLANDNCRFEHRPRGGPQYGENLYMSRGLRPGPADVVNGWAAEVDCWTFGVFFVSDMCDMTCTARLNASGCGHYTQLVWRGTRQVGCGRSVCESGAEIWACNYNPAGNFIGQEPY